MVYENEPNVMIECDREAKLEWFEDAARQRTVARTPQHEYLSEQGKRILFLQGEQCQE